VATKSDEKKKPKTGDRKKEDGKRTVRLYEGGEGTKARGGEGASASVTFLRHTEIKVEK
jgi:hypothetical protein